MTKFKKPYYETVLKNLCLEIEEEYPGSLATGDVDTALNDNKYLIEIIVYNLTTEQYRKLAYSIQDLSNRYYNRLGKHITMMLFDNEETDIYFSFEYSKLRQERIIELYRPESAIQTGFRAILKNVGFYSVDNTFTVSATGAYDIPSESDLILNLKDSNKVKYVDKRSAL